MDKPTPDERVKQVTLAEGYLHIDLEDGMRLSGPARRAPAAPANKPRLVETGPGSAWGPDLNLDGLMPDPA